MAHLHRPPARPRDDELAAIAAALPPRPAARRAAPHDLAHPVPRVEQLRADAGKRRSMPELYAYDPERNRLLPR